MSILSKPYFHDEAAAFAHVEAILWANGRVCPHCGTVDNSYPLRGVRSKPSTKNPEGVERHGLYKCGDCRKQFTVRKGTIFEESHLPMHKWLQAIYLMCASKKGFSAHQMHRVLEVQYRTAWFLCHRIREAMRTGGELDIFGAGGGSVEVDETYLGREPGAPKKRGYGHKMKVLALVDRNTGQARSMVIDQVNKATIMPILQANISKEARLLTDDAGYYLMPGLKFADHQSVNHSAGEYVRRGQPEIHTNTIEGYFSVFKRGMKGTYQHCGKQHLHRYLAEFDFRYNNRSANGIEDGVRADIALRGVAGKRLTYRRTHVA
jgi:transposase-like protein